MKMYTNLKELSNDLEISYEYLNNKVGDFLACQGSEIFNSKKDVTIDVFKYEGVKINDNIIYIASVVIAEDEYKEYYILP